MTSPAANRASRSSSDIPSPAPDLTLRWAVRVLFGEAALIGVLTLWAIWAAITTTGVSVQSEIATPVFTAVCGALVGGLATALSRKKALARGPAIVIEMLMIPIGYYAIVGGLVWLGVPMMIVGLAGAGLLLAPSTRTALGLTYPR